MDSLNEKKKNIKFITAENGICGKWKVRLWRITVMSICLQEIMLFSGKTETKVSFLSVGIPGAYKQIIIVKVR